MVGMEKVGIKFRENKVFVPQVLMSAKAMSAAMDHLKPYFTSGAAERKGVFVVGTVEGDLHDIGKNLVAMMVEGNGYEVIDLGTTLASDTKVMKNTLVNYMLISSIFIVCILFYIAGKNILFPLMYLLFPISSVLFAITLLGKINIMHMFALVILLAISIDYGIYLYDTTTTSKTKIAIKYALLSTVCGFGVLIFSSTIALYSIGFVISVGVGAIFLLLYASL